MTFSLRDRVVFRRSGKLEGKRRTREDYEREAALILAERIAEGRPPPDVWRKAAETQAKKGQSVGGYAPDGAGAHLGSHTRRVPEPVPVGEPLVLRVVRLPASAPAIAPLGDQSARPAVVNASTDYRP